MIKHLVELILVSSKTKVTWNKLFLDLFIVIYYLFLYDHELCMLDVEINLCSVLFCLFRTNTP